jgi:hypothetical protein
LQWASHKRLSQFLMSLKSIYKKLLLFNNNVFLITTYRKVQNRKRTLVKKMGWG